MSEARNKDTDIALLEQGMEQVRDELTAQRETLDDQSKKLNEITVKLVKIDGTLGEISRRLERGDKAIDAVPDLLRRIGELEADARERKANQTWLWRALVGGLITVAMPGIVIVVKAAMQNAPVTTMAIASATPSTVSAPRCGSPR